MSGSSVELEGDATLVSPSEGLLPSSVTFFGPGSVAEEESCGS